MPDSTRAQSLLHELSGAPPAIDQSRIELLFQDFVACSVRGERKYGYPLDNYVAGISDRAVRLGLYASAEDLDDVDWQVLTHPGSIVWPTAVAIGVVKQLPFEMVKSAAAYGYRTGASLAKMFGTTHRSKWHLTSTSGAFAATSTAAIAMGMSQEQHLNALHICAANIGGSPQAGFERGGGAQTNRAAAISLGITSAQSASIGAPHVKNIWDGPRGLVEMFSVEANDFELRDGVSTAELRLMPTNGFTHSAVFAAWKLRQRTASTPEKIVVILPLASKALLDGSLGGDWWNPKFAIAALWQSGDPMLLSDARDYLPITEVEFEEMPIRSGKVRVHTSSSIDEEFIDRAPEETPWIKKKWQSAELGTPQESYLRCSNFPLSALR